MNKLVKAITALGAVAATGGMIMLSAPASAAAVTTGAATIRTVAPNDVVDVQWGRRGWRRGGGAFAAGIATGIFLGAAAASRPYYDEPYPAYGYEVSPAYGYENYGYEPRSTYEPGVVYESAPVVVERPSRCWVATDKDRGFGYWGRC